MGKLVLKSKHRLLCGDSTTKESFEKLMNGETAHMVWTDPPYNVGYVGRTKNKLTIQNDSMSDEDFYQFIYQAYLNLLHHSIPGSAIYVAHSDTEGANFRLAMIKSGWLFKQCLIWVKNALVLGRSDYHWRHEPILYGWAPGASHNWYSDRKQTTVLEFNKPIRSEDHPTTKPVELIEYCITNSSKKEDNILDCFGGSGSTLIACEKTKRKCYMMELDPRYCQVIIDRYIQYSNKKVYIVNANNFVTEYVNIKNKVHIGEIIL